MKVSEKDLDTLLKHMESDSSLYGNTAVAALKALHKEAKMKNRASLELDDRERYILAVCWHTKDIQKELSRNGFKPNKDNVEEVRKELNWFSMQESAIKDGLLFIQDAIDIAKDSGRLK